MTNSPDYNQYPEKVVTVPCECSADSVSTPCKELMLAREYFAVGDTAKALHYAQQALAFHEHECAVHTLLGEIYNADGDHDSAKIHFQAAIAIKEHPTTIIDHTVLPTQHKTLPGIMMLVLISCILLSGVAALFSLHPSRHHLNEGDIFQLSSVKQNRNEVPRWTWKVPAPVKTHEVDTAQPTANLVSNPTPVKNNPTKDNSTSTQSTHVLGPSAHGQLPVDNNNITLQTAHDAYLRGEYQQALSIFEVIQSRETVISPDLQRDIAYCHQNLGNSAQAKINLRLALSGFQQQLLENADNIVAQKGIADCEIALKQLQNYREP